MKSKAVEVVLGILVLLGVVATIGASIGFAGFCAGYGWGLDLGWV